ncbi:hypothetical protein BJ165DRAFT_1611605 [Panaeolus papilionaceus]|nr:hypothetical protein BJ165DRAFT_1611605 [Panaeolus papilionaceus]
MTQLDDLAFCLLAAGGTVDPETGGMNLLYVDADSSSLISKPWGGHGREDKLGAAKLVTTDVRPGSTAADFIRHTDQSRIVACITSQNTVSVLEFKSNSYEWIHIPFEDCVSCDVHPQGQITGFVGGNSTGPTITFQNPSGTLTVLRHDKGCWNSQAIPVDVASPVVGSPLSMALGETKFRVFYISAIDNCLHTVEHDDSQGWKDTALANCSFASQGTLLKRLSVLVDDRGVQAYLLDEEQTVWRYVERNGRVKMAGKMIGSKFRPDSSDEFSYPLFPLHTDPIFSAVNSFCVIA